MKKAIGTGAVFVALALTLFPAVSISAVKSAMSLCAGTLIPALFPFFVCANLLISSGITAWVGRFFEKPFRVLFRVGGEAAVAVLLGFISGYPAGAAITCRLYANGSISRWEAQRLLAFTNNAGPLFIIGAVGTTLYNQPSVGYLLLTAQTLASVVTGLCMRFSGSYVSDNRAVLRRTPADPVSDAVHTVLTLCGYVLFFSVISSFLEHLGILHYVRRLFTTFGMGDKTAALCAAGLFEISTVAQISGALPATAALLSFGGLSVLLQTASLVRKAGLSIKSYLFGKAISTGCAALFCRILLMLFPPFLSAGNFPDAKPISYTISASTHFLWPFTTCLVPFLLYFLRKKLQKRTPYGTIKKKTKRCTNDYILQ